MKTNVEKPEPTRLPSWRQDDPMMQYRFLLGTLRAEILNIQDGIADQEAYDRIERWVNELDFLGKHYLQKEW